jgi:hypothetical protein
MGEMRDAYKTFVTNLTTMSRMALGPTQPPIQWVSGALSLRVKQLGCEADHSPPSSAEVKECMELYLHFPQYAFMAWCLVKHRDNFTFTFYLKVKDHLKDIHIDGRKIL